MYKPTAVYLHPELRDHTSTHRQTQIAHVVNCVPFIRTDNTTGTIGIVAPSSERTQTDKVRERQTERQTEKERENQKLG